MVLKTTSGSDSGRVAEGAPNVALPRFLAYMPGGLSPSTKGVSFVAIHGVARTRREDSTVRSTRELG